MSIEDDVALLERVPTLRLLGTTALRMLAIGSEQRDFARGDQLFKRRRRCADAGYVVQRGAFRIEDGGAEIVAGPGALIGELALIVGDEAAVERDRAGTFLGRSVWRAACFSACSKAILPRRAGCAMNSPTAPASSPATF